MYKRQSCIWIVCGYINGNPFSLKVDILFIKHLPKSSPYHPISMQYSQLCLRSQICISWIVVFASPLFILCFYPTQVKFSLSRSDFFSLNGFDLGRVNCISKISAFLAFKWIVIRILLLCFWFCVEAFVSNQFLAIDSPILNRFQPWCIMFLINQSLALKF